MSVISCAPQNLGALPNTKLAGKVSRSLGLEQAAQVDLCRPRNCLTAEEPRGRGLLV